MIEKEDIEHIMNVYTTGLVLLKDNTSSDKIAYEKGLELFPKLFELLMAEYKKVK